jgi:hypothetical protein
MYDATHHFPHAHRSQFILEDLTIGQRRVGDFFERHIQRQAQRGLGRTVTLCVCSANSKLQTRCSGADREGILSERLKAKSCFPVSAFTIHCCSHSIIDNCNFIAIECSLTI